MNRRVVWLRRDIKAALKMFLKNAPIEFYISVQEIPPNSLSIRDCQGNRFMITIEKLSNETP